MRNTDLNSNVKLLQFLLDVYSRTANDYVSSREVFKGRETIDENGKKRSGPLTEQYGVSNTYAVGLLIEAKLLEEASSSDGLPGKSRLVKWCAAVPDLGLAKELKIFGNGKYPPKPKIKKEEVSDLQPHLLEVNAEQNEKNPETLEEKINAIYNMQKEILERIISVEKFVNL